MLFALIAVRYLAPCYLFPVCG